ncbi:glycolate oxidase iron-sulfur subunit [Rhodobacter sp. TJ_12]|uniref:glycolate oxidase subunit GlcF n=1 Tax=Rhodobacter sp. TJ_12 TaxID=2029399 RepID=UPI001CC10017|nr:glycolate oxidase subunit GlcF [Rhodobacter sp. TJ_12]MBZ4023166.1 glycolate oxidase iron-sulfur subunit [Rhodobacter sp. TJ_12]
MQTSFTPDQLADPEIARANKILRACVHCGFCTATCPSYQVLGDELDSPRGRIYLIKEMLETGRPADARTAKHIDRCLGCLACMTTCPSGVDYMHLIDHARAHVERTYKRPAFERFLRFVLAETVPYPRRFRFAMRGARLAKPFAWAFPDARLKAMLAMAPDTLPKPSQNDRAQTFAPIGPRRYRVALQTGCAQKALDTDINDATIRLLRRLGCEVVIPKKLGCCGALSHHMGREAESHAQAAANIRAYGAAGDVDAIIINTSGCGTTVKDYGVIFEGAPLQPQAEKVAGLAKDITEFLQAVGLPEAAPKGLRVAYHSACSLQHGQQIKTAPKDLLQRAGFEVVEPLDPHLCCGSAGTYNLLQPEISAELRRRKVDTLHATAPQVIAAGNIGCMVQIGTGTQIPVVHTVELLDWALGGPKPRALAGLP